MRFGVLSVVLFASNAVAAPKKEPPPPPLPAPEVSLQVEPKLGAKWRVTVTNKSSTPLRIVADVRVLRFSIEPPPSTTPLKKGQKPPPTVECVLPGTMRKDDVQLTLPAGAKWTDEFDVRLHCLDRVDKLIEGATVTAKLGWAAPKGGKLNAPFAVNATTTDVASAKEIVAAPFTLTSNVISAPAPSKDPVVANGGGARSLGNGKDIDMTIVLKNVSKESKTLYPRPQLVDARVINPRGQETKCTGANIQPAPIIDFATKLAPNGTWQATASLSHLCPPGTFDRPGLYQIIPLITLPPMPQVANEVSGVITADKPQLLRIETGTKPFADAPPAVAKP